MINLVTWRNWIIWFLDYQVLETYHTFLTDQLATGTGSDALKSKITPSLPWNVVPLDSLQLDDSGRRMRAAKDDISTAQATAAQYSMTLVKCLKERHPIWTMTQQGMLHNTSKRKLNFKLKIHSDTLNLVAWSSIFNWYLWRTEPA